MRLGYTEFSFGYAFTENLVRSLTAGPIGAPVFPNLIQEAQLGYDVRLDLPGCPLFFQYKLPELMVKNSAAEISKHQLAGIHVPFFRMPLMRRDLSHQHALLMRLEQRFPARVFYSTPCLQRVSDFNAAYSAARIHRRSVFLSPRNIGPLPDDKSHSIAYRDGLHIAYLCSTPRKIRALKFEDIERTILQTFKQARFRTLERASKVLRDEIIRLVTPEMRGLEGQIRERIRARGARVGRASALSERAEEVIEDVLVSKELSRVGLGLDLVVAQPRPADPASGLPSSS